MENSNKIKVLTDKIYRDGIEKANEEAQQIISESEKEAARIIVDATKEAEKIVIQAEKEALNISERRETELRLSSQQSLSALRKEIAELIQVKVLREPLEKAFEDHEFMKRMLELIIRKWDPTKVDTGFKVLVPQDKLDEIEQYFKEKAGDLLNNGLSLKGEKDLKMGFEILPQNENYKISITDSSFEAFLNTHFNEEIISFLFKKDN